jgi:hypothetical protein
MFAVMLAWPKTRPMGYAKSITNTIGFALGGAS